MDSKTRFELKTIIADSLRRYAENYQIKTTHPLDLILPEERKLRSFVGGLETSMGVSIWEKLAVFLADRNGYNALSPAERIAFSRRPDPMPVEIVNLMGRLVYSREFKQSWISLEEVACRVRAEIQANYQGKLSNLALVAPSSGSGIDILLEKDGRFRAFDLKTVQPNVSNVKNFNKQLIEWIVYALLRDVDIDFQAQIAYPYNPWGGSYERDFWSRSVHRNGPLLCGVEALVEDEFWDNISGYEGTYSYIEECFIELQEEGLGTKIRQILLR